MHIFPLTDSKSKCVNNMDIIVLLSLYDIKMWYFRQKEHKGGGWGQSYSRKDITPNSNSNLQEGMKRIKNREDWCGKFYKYILVLLFSLSFFKTKNL